MRKEPTSLSSISNKFCNTVFVKVKTWLNTADYPLRMSDKRQPFWNEIRMRIGFLRPENTCQEQGVKRHAIYSHKTTEYWSEASLPVNEVRWWKHLPGTVGRP